MHHRAKLRQSRLNRGRDMAIFQFFKMATTAKRVELHHRTKFIRNRSNRG